MRVMSIVFVLLICVTALVYFVWKATYLHCCKRIKYYKDLSNKFNRMYMVSEKWLEAQLKDVSIGKYIKDCGWKNIAIYGCGVLGKNFCKSIEKEDVNVICGIDKNINVDFPFKVVEPNQFHENVDVIIVTAVYYFFEIEQVLKSNTSANIISLEEIIYGCLY